ncbi:transporter substrate-binding domain-containing protein [Pseudomonas sp. Irchel 3A5]|uniref:transporter substrate-binding domain-containing protein n=1 Tax=Pseudomonas sp. Irchel 3A5 TaxID=2008911 RepID=UPI000BA3B0F9|nr:transporter substrate-binding domain-containing protein [Pseudomonas sp. Irchel 3A5]
MPTIKSKSAYSLILLAITGLLSLPALAVTEVRFGIEADVPPFESRNINGELVGLNIDLGNAICARMNVRCVWVDQPYATNIAALQAHAFDVIMPMTPTDARKQQVDFTDVMYPLSSRLVAAKGSLLEPTAAALKGKRIGVLKGTSREAFALAAWASKGVDIQSFGLNAELIGKLLTGELDATLQDSIEISEALLSKPEGSRFDFASPPITDPMLGSGVAMAVRKSDQTLKLKLNEALATLKADGTQQAIVERYLAPMSHGMTNASSLQFMGAGAGKPFSQAVRAGDFLYLSGLLGDDANGHFPESTAAQTKAIMDNMRKILESNGSSLKDVVKCTVILANIKDFADMNKVYAGYFAADRFPARTTFEAGKLVANGKIEIECMAYVGHKSQ